MTTFAGGDWFSTPLDPAACEQIGLPPLLHGHEAGLRAEIRPSFTNKELHQYAGTRRLEPQPIVED